MTSDLARSGPETAAAVGMETFEFEPHNCFACGSLNENGLRLDLHLGERRSWTELTLDPRFEGWDGVAHGGIVATILDEVMAWSLVAEDNWGVTARMSVDYRRPTPIGTAPPGRGLDRPRPPTAGRHGRPDRRRGRHGPRHGRGRYVAADEARKRELQARYGYRARAARNGTAADTPEPVDAR